MPVAVTSRFRSLLDQRFGLTTVAALLVLGRLIEGMVVSAHQLTLTRVSVLNSLHPSASQGPLVNLEHWDSAWYAGIALHGYTSTLDAAYFPGYPVLADVVRGLTLGTASASLALFAVSWGSLLAFAVVFIELGRLLGLARSASLVALIAVLFSPGSCFLIAWYPLSLYLLLSSAAFTLLLRGRDWAAAIAAGVASAVTPIAFALSVALSLHFLLLQRRGALTSRLLKSATSVWGAGVYLIYCQSHFGSYLEPLKAQANWSEKIVVPFASLPTIIREVVVGHFDRAANAYFGLNLVCEVLALAVVIRLLVAFGRRQIRGDHATFSVFTAASLVIPATYVGHSGSFLKPIGFARQSGASVGFGVELERGVRSRTTRVAFMLMWFVLGLLGQILFCGGWFT